MGLLKAAKQLPFEIALHVLYSGQLLIGWVKAHVLWQVVVTLSDIAKSGLVWFIGV